MIAASDPYQVVGGFGLVFLFLAGLWQLIVWVREAPVKPDPWNAEVEQKLSEPETAEVCSHCLTEQPPTAWFCRHCGKAVGPYNNLMPFVNVFSEGEVFRNGATGRFRNRPLVILGYLMLSLAAYSFFAPVFWVVLLSNLKRPPHKPEATEEQNVPP
jgi:ribosomal protein L40E